MLKPDNELCNNITRISQSVLVIHTHLITRHSKRSTNKDKNKEEEKKQPGTYKTKEEIEKPPKMDHPCNLTRTTVRISFPELKGEVFVNLLGYKEPNLIPLWRCKGTFIFYYLKSQTLTVPEQILSFRNSARLWLLNVLKRGSVPTLRRTPT